MDYRVAKSLLTLRSQVNAAHPNRDKSSDGTIGDDRHAATKSEHNPDENGVVRALDITNDPAHGVNARALAQALLDSRDTRILYCISNKQMARSYPKSGTTPWQWAPYSGVNDHVHHMHVSVVDKPWLYDDDRPWAIAGGAAPAFNESKPVVPAGPATIAELQAKTVADVVRLAADSELIRHAWRDRGLAPRGYVKGMAVAMAVAQSLLRRGDTAAVAMAVKPHADGDAMGWYLDKIANYLDHGTPADHLRGLFILMMGLGMRESSGRYCEGRDRSADNTTADTAEAGLFQMSWDAHAANTAELTHMLIAERAKPASDEDGLLSIFREGVTPRPHDLEVYGHGDGADFQRLCKTRPLFAVLTAGVGLRVIRKHWGPINRREVEIFAGTDALFRKAQAAADAEHPAAM